MKRDLISILDFENEIEEILDLAIRIKAKVKGGEDFSPLK